MNTPSDRQGAFARAWSPGLTRLALGGVLVASLGLAVPVAQSPPLLWRIEGPVPSYLFGTIHVPDPRVLELPSPVEQAFAEADSFWAELPLDADTQTAVARRLLLPADQTLADVVGAPLFDRLVSAVARRLGGTSSGPVAVAGASLLGRLKPWAAGAQLSVIEYLPDVLAGRQPLDAMLYARARELGKTVGGLETLDEQIAVFEGFTRDEQIALLESTVAEFERTDGSPARELVELYLRGDLTLLSDLAHGGLPEDQPLREAFARRVVLDRNVRLAERITDRLTREPDRVHFFAVGALHFAGARGIPPLLAERGLRNRHVAGEPR